MPISKLTEFVYLVNQMMENERNVSAFLCGPFHVKATLRFVTRRSNGNFPHFNRTRNIMHGKIYSYECPIRIIQIHMLERIIVTTLIREKPFLIHYQS